MKNECLLNLLSFGSCNKSSWNIWNTIILINFAPCFHFATYNICTVWFINLFLFWYCLSVKLEQGTVTSIVEEDGTVKGVQYKTKNGQELTSYAPLTIVCDGGFSNLRRNLCKPQVISLECIGEVNKFPIVVDVHWKRCYDPFCRLIFPHALLVWSWRTVSCPLKIMDMLCLLTHRLSCYTGLAARRYAA